MVPIRHVVLFTPKPELSAAEAQNVFDDMLALKDRCVKPDTKQAYIQSLVGGKDNSPEGMQQGLTHIFIVEFASAEDRDYYVNMDPAHRAFVEKHAPSLAKAQVVDFTPGVF